MRPASPFFAAFVSFAFGCGVCCTLSPLTVNVHAAFPGSDAAPDATQRTSQITGDWTQWGGDAARNNVPVATNLPEEWDVGGFDRKTKEWQSEEAQHIKWVAAVGSQTYGNPVVAKGKVYVGTNNGHGYLARYPADTDLGCLLAFDESDGDFLWQHSSEKLITGRVHDWPLQGICCAPYVDGDRLWYVTSRGTVVCLDTEGFLDDEDDGPAKAGLARLFKEPAQLTAGLDDGDLGAGLIAMIEGQTEVRVGNRFRVETLEEGREWQVGIRVGRERQFFGVTLAGDRVALDNRGLGKQPGTPQPVAEAPNDLTQGLSDGAPNLALRLLLSARGVTLAPDASSRANGGRAWSVRNPRETGTQSLTIRFEGPNLSAYKQLTIHDNEEADEVWIFDMMGELDVSQHNMCSCSVTAWGDILFVNTSNGVDESHKNIPSVRAPSFIALDKNTGELLWTDDSPGGNILHGQWSSPAVGMLGGVPQAIFAGGDGWVYSFRADRGKDGRPDLLWKFDANPKESEWILGGRGTRNNIIATPVLYKDRVYVAVGQDPEHGPGNGHLWCIDPKKRGDVSTHMVVHVNDRATPVPHRRLRAIDEEAGEVAIDNPNSAAIWHYIGVDQDGDGELAMHESMNRSCGTVAIKDDILYIADFSGIFHCLNAMTGESYWTYDMMSQAWGSPLIADGKVYIGDEDGEVAVFPFAKDANEPTAEVDMLNSVYSTPIVANNVLYIANKTHLFAIQKQED